MIFCTLFDSNYLDKGLVLYASLTRVLKDFKMYVLAMDVRCQEILLKMNCNNMVVLDLEEFVKKTNLVKIRKERSRGEFCWTCTSHLIDYVLNYYHESICTYVDADLYFFSDPSILIEEMGTKSVQIVEHGFSNSLDDRITKKRAGTYCVEFNTFKNTSESINLLKWWQAKCKESCSNSKNDGVFGDQMYLENWGEYPFVSILENKGGGLAPWNVGQYVFLKRDENGFLFKNKISNREYNLVFYHFHNINYISQNTVKINVFTRKWHTDDRLIKEIYYPYLSELNDMKNYLKDHYGFFPMLLSHPELKPTNKLTIADILHTLKNNNFRSILEKFYIKMTQTLKNRIFSKKDIISF